MRRTGLRILVAGVAILAIAAAWLWYRHREERREHLQALEAEVREVLEQARDRDPLLPGLSAAFVLPDGRVGTAAVGFADVENEVAMTPDTRFMAGSVGKSFFSALALALHEEGRVDLDAPIERWLGDEPWFERLPNGPDVTLRMLLQHRSGIDDHLTSFEFLAKTLGKRLSDGEDASMTPEELVAVVLDDEPLFEPGQGFAYGDTNYVLAGMVMERAAGRSAFRQVEERFLGPLDLDAIVVAWERHIPNLAAGYQLPVNPFLLPRKMAEEERLKVDPMVESTAGGLAMAARGIVGWARALFEGRALAGDSLDALVGRSVETGDGRRYGLGVFVYTTDLGAAWGHGGWFPGYRSELRYFPDARIAVAVQANRDFLVDVEAILMDVAVRVEAATR